MVFGANTVVFVANTAVVGYQDKNDIIDVKREDCCFLWQIAEFPQINRLLFFSKVSTRNGMNYSRRLLPSRGL